MDYPPLALAFDCVLLCQRSRRRSRKANIRLPCKHRPFAYRAFTNATVTAVVPISLVTDNPEPMPRIVGLRISFRPTFRGQIQTSGERPEGTALRLSREPLLACPYGAGRMEMNVIRVIFFFFGLFTSGS